MSETDRLFAERREKSIDQMTREAWRRAERREKHAATIMAGYVSNPKFTGAMDQALDMALFAADKLIARVDRQLDLEIRRAKGE